jgi:hypothetical protein
MLLAKTMREILWSIACLVVTVSPVTAVTLLPPGHTWEYTFTNPTADSTWNTTTGLGGIWSAGPAPFGNNTSDPLGSLTSPRFGLRIVQTGTTCGYGPR